MRGALQVSIKTEAEVCKYTVHQCVRIRAAAQLFKQKYCYNI